MIVSGWGSSLSEHGSLNESECTHRQRQGSHAVRDNNLYQHHQEHNSISSTSSRVSPSVSVLMGMAFTSASDVGLDEDEAKELHSPEVVNQEEEVVILSQGGFASRDGRTSPSPFTFTSRGFLPPSQILTHSLTQIHASQRAPIHSNLPSHAHPPLLSPPPQPVLVPSTLPQPPPSPAEYAVLVQVEVEVNPLSPPLALPLLRRAGGG